MNFRTYHDLTNCLVNNLGKIPEDVDLIVGIPRSGTMVGNILALYLNRPFTDLYSFVEGKELHSGDTRKSEQWIKQISEAKHVLVVDDSVSSGSAINKAKSIINESNISCKITYMAVYVLSMSRGKVDIYLEVCEQPRMFEWNYMHHWELENSCMDIDGVICEDPSFFQNDDGRKYEDFIKNAKPKFIPTQKVGKLVTSRLEKYRGLTEQWLKEHNVIYDELIMMDNVTAKERALLGSHAQFKADVYKKSDKILFFESNYDQALEICRISGKPVYCIENMELIESSNVINRISSRSKEFKVTVKHAVKKCLKMIKKKR